MGKILHKWGYCKSLVGIIEHLLYIKLLGEFMKRHSLAMVFLLITILSLIGAVSASENLAAVDVDSSIYNVQDYAQIEISDEYVSESVGETVSISHCDVEKLDEACQRSVSYNSYSPQYLSSSGQGQYSDEGIDDNVGEFISISGETLSFSDNENDLLVSSYNDLEGINLDDSISHFQTIGPDSTGLVGECEFGYGISNILGSLLDLNTANEVLDVTIDLTKIDKLAIENVLNEIISSSNGYVKNGYDNLLELSSIKTGLINVKFIKDAGLLTISLCDKNETILYNAGQEISAGLWDMIIGSWANGIIKPSDVLGSDSGQSGDESSRLTRHPTEFDLPLEDTSDYVLGVPRDSDADAFIWSVDNTSGKRACIGVALVNESTNGLLKSSLSDTALESQNKIDLKQIGVDATNKALAYFKSIGIDIKKGYPKFYVLTSASYVKIKGTSTESVLNGISEVLGSKKNIYPIHTPLWKDLVFYYIWVNNANNRDMSSYALVYDESTGKFIVSSEARKQGDDMAYKMGLYDKSQPYHGHGHKSIINPFVGDISSAGVVNDTNITGNLKDNETVNDTVLVEISKKIIDDMPKADSNPLSIVVVILSIVAVYIFFRLSYTRKD